MEDADLELALSLQAEYDKELEGLPSASERPSAASQKSLSIVDPALDLLDPNPDIRELFKEFNSAYFWGKLDMVEVKWSPRMTLCAGVCSYEGHGGLCSVRLSKPLLALRPRKDLVETLLHEMIHAYLFVTANNRDRDGHGPEFCKHMRRINEATGAHITIYHTFRDEVNEMRQHWWRCQGPCQYKSPYFGYVRRAMNRAPSPRDFWWNEHQQTCGGTFIKIKEPENYGKKKKSGHGQKTDVADIKKYLSPNNKSKSVSDTSKTLNGKKDDDRNTPTEISNVHSSGNRLGGILRENNNGRGIPLSSLLLSSHPQQSSLPSMESKKFLALNPDSESQKVLMKENDSTPNLGTTVVMRTKISSRLENFLAKMKRRGRKSVNAGAPALKTVPVVSRFNSRAVIFHDDSQGIESESFEINNENIEDVSPQEDNMMKNEHGKFFVTKRDCLKSPNSGLENWKSQINGGLSRLSSHLGEPNLSMAKLNGKVNPIDCSIDLTDCDEMGKFGSSSTEIGFKYKSNGKFASDTICQIENRSPSVNKFSPPAKPKNVKRHLPSLSDDENETLIEVWQSQFGSKKKRKVKSPPREQCLDEDLPEHDMKGISGFSQNIINGNVQQKTNGVTAVDGSNLDSLNTDQQPLETSSETEFASNVGDSFGAKSPSLNCQEDENGYVNSCDSLSCTNKNSSQQFDLVTCPICGMESSAKAINYHIDDCLSMQAISNGNWS